VGFARRRFEVFRHRNVHGHIIKEPFVLFAEPEEIGRMKFRTAQIAMLQVRLAHVRLKELRLVPVYVSQYGPSKIRAFEIDIAQISAGQVNSRKFGRFSRGDFVGLLKKESRSFSGRPRI
jgi:hypothetical protein